MGKDFKKQYSTKEWKEYSEKIKERDNFACQKCGAENKTLQVHHLEYIQGKNPWEYDNDYCITLCKGCHYKEHNKKGVRYHWEYIGFDDLGDLVGECELCGTAIRYEHEIYNDKFGSMFVGCCCAENLTGDDSPSINEKESKLYLAKLARFLKSPKWKRFKNKLYIRRKPYLIEIFDNGDHYRLRINKKVGKIKFDKLQKAQEHSFKFIESGDADNYFT